MQSGSALCEDAAAAAPSAEVARLRAENEELRREREELRAALLEANNSSNSEGRLRGLLASHTATPAQLRQAIAGAESLIEEAKRELAAKQLRERRAAYEKLHAALERASTTVDEEELAEALMEAHAAGLDSEDVEKGEAKLAELRALTDEERAARVRRSAEITAKKDAFLLVKKDNADALVAFLDALEPETRWQDWHDYAGRTLRRCAQDLRSTRVQEVLAARIEALGENQKLRFKPLRRRTRSRSLGSEGPEEAAAEAPEQAAAQTSPPRGLKVISLLDEEDSSEGAEETPAPAYTNGTHGPGAGGTHGLVTPTGFTVRSPAEGSPDMGLTGEDRFKARALRAAVQDDCETLTEVLEIVPTDTWSKWQNKAGQDLLTLSQVRGATSAYAVLAKALGIVHEMKREAYEEREAVWVFLPGDVQPRRATVLEDTPEEVDEVLLEYWDGDAPPERVERCLVRRIGG